MSDQADAEEAESLRVATPPSYKQGARPSARRTFLKALGVRQEDHPPLPTGDAGMENGVLGRMEGQDLGAQMKEFYSAYSKVSSTLSTQYTRQDTQLLTSVFFSF